MVTLASADAYFGPSAHILAKIWRSYGPQERTAALTMAHRLITRANGGIEPEDDATNAQDIPRPDLAVYEQALYMLRNSPLVADGAAASPKFDGGTSADPFEPREATDPYGICAEARRWLQYPRSPNGMSAVIELTRG